MESQDPSENTRHVLVQDDLVFYGNQGEDVYAFIRRFKNSALGEKRKYLIPRGNGGWLMRRK